jgi:TrmH family RNA methyltransferase
VQRRPAAWPAPGSGRIFRRLLASCARRVCAGSYQKYSNPTPLFRELSGLESPSGVGFVLELPTGVALRADVASVILDRVQDAGNVGSILRSAAAFGFRQVIALKGTAALWSPKVLRSGMGAHFGLTLLEGVEVDACRPCRCPLW